MSILGIDVGTTCIKAQAFDEKNNPLVKYSLEYDVIRNNNISEINIKKMTENIFIVIENVSKQLAEKKEKKICGICVSSLGESFIPIAKNGEVLANSMLYTDKRGENECEELIDRLGRKKISSICGCSPHPMYGLPKMMWIKNNKPLIYEKTWKFLSIGDYVYYLLTGLAVTDYSLATRTMAFNIRKLTWSETMLNAAGINESRLPKPQKSGSIIGKVLPKVMEDLNLDKDCVVITGGHDQLCAAVGAGVVKVGQCNDGTGTVECMTIMFDKAPMSYNYYKSGYAVIPYAIDGTYITYAFNFTGGALLKWFRDKVVDVEYKNLKKKNINIYQQYENNDINLPTNLLILPHFAGSATPYMDRESTGMMVGVNIATTKIDIFHALMEGATFEMRTNLDVLKRSGVQISECTATGGGAKSQKWLQIKANILNKPIYPLKSAEGGISGCIIMAMVALGIENSIEEAINKYVVRGKSIDANQDMAKCYTKQYEKYRKLYKSMKEIIK